MAKTFIYRLFGLGKVPKSVDERIDEEKLIYVEEGISVTIIYDHYKAPGKYFKHKIRKMSGAICLTEKGLYCSAYSHVIIQLGWNDPKFSAIQIDVKKDKICMKVEVSLFDDKSEGTVEYRFKCNNPDIVLNHINQIIASKRK